MRFVIIPFAAVALVGCASLESEDIETDGINASMALSSSPGEAKTSVTVTLRAGNSLLTFVDLGEGDTLKATQGDETITLDESSILDAVSYNGTLNTDAPGTEVTVSFERSEHDPAPSSTVLLAERLNFTAPAAASTFSRANDAIDVQLDSEETELVARVEWRGDCVEDGARELTADQRQVTIEAGSIQKKPDPEEGQPIPDDCDVQLRLVRTRSGTLDPAFGGGQITHTYSDTLTFTSNP